jgi:protein O-GlcNAc transferase
MKRTLINGATSPSTAASDLFQKATKLHSLAQLDKAISIYQKVLRLDERFHLAWYAQGCAWETKGDDAEALACFRKALSLAPEHAETHHNMGKVLHKLGLTDEAMERFRSALVLGKGFLPRTAVATLIPGSPSATNGTILEARRSWAETHLPPVDPQKSFQRQAAHGRMRIGYLSSFFHSQNWMKPVWGLLNHHDRDRFEVFLFSDSPEAACLPCYRKHMTDQFYDIKGHTNTGAADLIEKCNLDVLVDLNGYSRIDRLAVIALKPSPIIVGWFNLYATSGMACYDYLIGDDTVIPPKEETFYTEKILRVPGCYLTFEVLYPTPDIVDPPVTSSGKNITFGCLASQYKITEPVVEAWSRILVSAQGTRLFIKNATLGSLANREFLAQRFESHGVARDRITMEGPADHFDYLSAYGRMDLALDTFPYNGGTTTSEALWQGVPVITFPGDRWAARQSTSISRAAGLGEFVCRNLDDYISCAIALATHPDTPDRLRGLRRAMRSRLTRSTLCNTVGFARNMENLFEEIVGR